MAAPHVHARSSAKRWGGLESDYEAIHVMMDSSKSAVSCNRHRCVFHTSFGCSVIIPAIFGPTITNSDGKVVSTKDIAEYHVLEDYRGKFIPTLQDFCENMEFQPWMDNGRVGHPNSAKKLLKDNQPAIDHKD